MKVCYVMEQTSLAGGHKDIFEQANRLAERGHDVRIFSVAADASHWFPLQVAHRSYGSYPMLAKALGEFEGIRIATWWKTAPVVAAAGGRAYFVQDVETSYCSSPREAAEVMATYRLGLETYTESRWVADQLWRLGVGGAYDVGIGVDTDVFHPADLREAPSRTVLFHERDHFLKGPELRASVLAGLGGRFHTLGYSPWKPNRFADDHLRSPSDAVLAEQMRRSLCLLVTSRHEGLCMPAMEAMAAGLPVVTTDADGNWFCQDGYNCLMGETSAELVEHIEKLAANPDLWRALRAGGLETVIEHFGWSDVIDRLEIFLTACG